MVNKGSNTAANNRPDGVDVRLTAPNPWEQISLKDYEEHMKLASVMQQQALNDIMKSQFASCPAKTVMILGIAGGNGLEHIEPGRFEKVIGVDVNAGYLEACSKRYPALREVFKPVNLDLTRAAAALPHAGLVIANLFIEYVGLKCFAFAVGKIKPDYVSCVIQVDAGEDFVSDSPYIHTFDCLESVHRQIDAQELSERLASIKYAEKLRGERALPNGKKLLRLDFMREADRG